MKKIFNIIPFLLLILFTSCEKEEDPYQLPPPGDASLQKITMGPDYETVIFYDLESQKIAERNLYAWDLAFENGPEGFHVLINGGIGIQAANTGKTNFEEVTAAGGHTWLWDTPTGNIDTTAIGNWLDNSGNSKSEVYVIDLGVKHNHDRYKKMILQQVDPTSYTIRVANIDGTEEYTAVIAKEVKTNFTYFDLAANQVAADYEPAKEDWDLVFIRYRHVYYDMTPVTPYEVNGVLLNPYKTEATYDKSSSFESADVDFAMGLDYTNRKDLIGFDWKYFDFDKEAYVTDQKRIFFVKTSQGLYFKLRFIDFYDQNGVKGTPSFEQQRL